MKYAIAFLFGLALGQLMLAADEPQSYIFGGALATLYVFRVALAEFKGT